MIKTTKTTDANQDLYIWFLSHPAQKYDYLIIDCPHCVSCPFPLVLEWSNTPACMFIKFAHYFHTRHLFEWKINWLICWSFFHPPMANITHLFGVVRERDYMSADTHTSASVTASLLYLNAERNAVWHFKRLLNAFVWNKHTLREFYSKISVVKKLNPTIPTFWLWVWLFSNSDDGGGATKQYHCKAVSSPWKNIRLIQVL